MAKDRMFALSGIGRRLGGTILAAAFLFALISPGGASAAAKFDVEVRWGDTIVEPGDTATFVLTFRNVGDADSAAPVTVKDQLPTGMRVTGFGPTQKEWSCLGIGSSSATCQYAQPVDEIGPKELEYGFIIRRIHIEASCALATGCKAGVRPNTVQVWAGGSTRLDGTACGAAPPATPCAEAVDDVTFAAEETPPGFVEGSFAADVFGEPFPSTLRERQAGTHPMDLRVDFESTLTHGIARDGHMFTAPVSSIRTSETTLPRGLIGNPEAAPKCEPEDFLTEGSTPVSGGGPFANTTACPTNTQVGYIEVDLNMHDVAENGGFGIFGGVSFKRVAVYNLEPPEGVPADFGFHIGNLVDAHVYPSLDAASGYAIKATSPAINNLLPVRGVRFTMWGVPGDPVHDRFRAYSEVQPGGISYGAPPPAGLTRPFLTLPMDCGVENGPFLQRGDFWTDPGNFTPIEESAQPLNVSGCDDQRIRFEPKVRLQPTSRAAGGPTGLSVNLDVPQRDQAVPDYKNLYAESGNLHAIDTPPMKKAVITFPEGMTLSTSAAQGLNGCTPEQIGIATNSPVHCPESSRYGALTIHTPILPKDEPMEGDIFIAQQDKNPFGTFLAMYFVIHDESRGLLIKLPGRIDLDPKTGQVKTTFDDLPQFPVSDMELSIKGGVRAGLVNPATCGRKEIKAEFFSWAAPNTPMTRTSSYDVTQKPDGSPCVSSLGERQFKPDFSAGTVNPNAGSYSPFVFRLQRGDEDQEFSQLSTTLPPGLLANISKLDECSEAGIAQAEAAGRTGTAEQLFPSCPASSQIGTTDVGSGVGQVITYIPGKAYLAGPYKGAPLSLVVITPIVTGPYDLGVIAVRSAIHVNAQKGQATISTDPFPQIYRGIPVRLRDIRVKADTPQTMINPTSCNAMEVTARVTGTGGNLDSTADDTAVDLQNRFQAANCASLPFKPKLSFKLKGGTKRGDFPAFSAYLKGRPGDANIARSTVVLPASLFIEQGHIRTVCTRVQFAADQCPAGSIYGQASAKSPLFDEVLSGPVYLRSNGGERLLPDLVVKLNGKIEVVLAGFVDSVKSRVRNTFDVVPDAPVTFFSLKMRGGKRSLVVNHRDLCLAPSRATVELTAQNGKTHNTKPKVADSCGKAPKKSKQGKPGRGASR